MPHLFSEISNVAPRDILEMNKVPVLCNVLWTTQKGALSASRGDIHISYLSDCGHVYNSAFNPKLMTYTESYENSLHFSVRFQEYADALADRLVETYDLHDKDIVEIGSGQGDFLKMLCRRGNNHGYGFDPAYVDEGEDDGETAVSFVQAYYSEEFSDYPADFICCRHVLEHIDVPVVFLETVRKAIGDREETVVFFEVPNVLFTVQQLGIWDLIYEHVSYYSPYSLAYLFEQSGFEVLAVNETFGGQFVTIEAKLAGETAVPYLFSEAEREKFNQDIANFAANFDEKVAYWQGILTPLAQANKKVVIWGSGSKGVTFVNTMAKDANIQYAVDINPRKKGMFVAGSGQEIIAPEFLQTYQPDVVIIMNRNYETEIGNMLKDLNVDAKIYFA